MATALKLRRGTTSQHSTFTGAEGELTVDTTKDTAVVHDGTTAGGFPLVTENTAQTVSGAKTFTSNQVISVTDNTNAALRVTQLGTGNALVVEDSTNPDSTPFVIDANGNVGIGTSSLNKKLDMQIVSEDGIRIGTTDANKRFDISYDTTNNIIKVGSVFSSGYGITPLAFWTNQNERMRISAAGNVGIGTSSPSSPLTVVGKTTLDGNAFAIQESNPLEVQRTTGGDWIRLARGTTGTSKGVISFGYNSGGSYFSTAQISNNSDANSTNNSSMQFSTADSGGALAEHMRLTSAGLLQFNSGYGSVATAYGCRAWVNFDGTSNATNLTGTYSQTGTTVTVTITDHGYITGNTAFLDFTSGTAVDGAYTVTVTGANTFTVTQASRTTSGNVTDRRSNIRGSGNVSSVADTGTGDYTVNFMTAMPDANYSAVVTSSNSQTFIRDAAFSGADPTTTAVRVGTRTSTPSFSDVPYICVAIFR